MIDKSKINQGTKTAKHAYTHHMDRCIDFCRNPKLVIKESQAYDDIEFIIKTSTTTEGSFEIIKDRFNEHVLKVFKFN